jgi:hypothetical protein
MELVRANWPERRVIRTEMSKSFIGAVLGLALIGGEVAVAQKPVEDASGERHPNLAAAQRLSQ